MAAQSVYFRHSFVRRSMSWADYAACQGASPELFYPKQGYSSGPARKICAGCSVRTECLEWSIRNREWFGVWGGVAERKRRTMIRLRYGGIYYGVLGEGYESHSAAVGRS